MQDVKVTFNDGHNETILIITDEKPPVLDHEDFDEMCLDINEVSKIEYQKPDGTWAEVEYER